MKESQFAERLRAFANQYRESALSPKGKILKDLTEAIRYRPDDIMALRARSHNCNTKKMILAYGIDDLTRLMELDPEHREYYLHSRAYAYKFSGQTECSENDFREIRRMKEHIE